MWVLWGSRSEEGRVDNRRKKRRCGGVQSFYLHSSDAKFGFDQAHEASSRWGSTPSPDATTRSNEQASK
jgi:hypothetical protein